MELKFSGWAFHGCTSLLLIEPNGIEIKIEDITVSMKAFF